MLGFNPIGSVAVADVGQEYPPGTILPSGIASGEAFGTALVTGDTVLFPTGIASAQAFGIAAQVFPNRLPVGIPSAEAFGTPAIGEYQAPPLLSRL